MPWQKPRSGGCAALAWPNGQGSRHRGPLWGGGAASPGPAGCWFGQLGAPLLSGLFLFGGAPTRLATLAGVGTTRRGGSAISMHRQHHHSIAVVRELLAACRLLQPLSNRRHPSWDNDHERDVGEWRRQPPRLLTRFRSASAGNMEKKTWRFAAPSGLETCAGGAGCRTISAVPDAVRRVPGAV